MTVEAKVICDSISPTGSRLITVEANIHRFVLAELNTHRVFSRNSASSRAIPVHKQIDYVRNDTAFPVEFGSNQAGMQAGPPLEGKSLLDAQLTWRAAADSAVQFAERLMEMGVHKQVTNRLLEPFMWHRVIITSTDFENFFRQRCHKDAQPEIRTAAEAIRDAVDSSFPTLVRPGEYHMPYTDPDDGDFGHPIRDLVKLSVARCARVSYLTHDGTRDSNKDFELYDRLATQDPPHYSPMEHVATPVPTGGTVGNFEGWMQWRHIVTTSKVLP